MKVFAANAVLNAADVNEYCVNTIYAFKPSDQSVVSSTTLVDDNDLFATVAANKKYLFQLYVNGFSSSGVPGLKFQITFPAGTNLYGQATFTAVGAPNANAASYGASAFALPANGPSVHTGTSGGLGDLPISVVGILDTGGNAGTVKFRWAQDTSGGSATVVRQGSWMLLNRVS
jgi:hypothetical protein